MYLYVFGEFVNELYLCYRALKVGLGFSYPRLKYRGGACRETGRAEEVWSLGINEEGSLVGPSSLLKGASEYVDSLVLLKELNSFPW